MCVCMCGLARCLRKEWGLFVRYCVEALGYWVSSAWLGSVPNRSCFRLDFGELGCFHHLHQLYFRISSSIERSTLKAGCLSSSRGRLQQAETGL